MMSAHEPRPDLHAPPAGTGAVSPEPVSSTMERNPRRHWPRTILATLLILLGTLLTPAAAIGAWSKVVLTDTDAFVATLAPLAEDPRVQDYLTDQATDAIEERLGVDALVDAAIDGLSDLVTRPVAIEALDALREPAIAGVRSSIRQATERVVTSDKFAGVWEQSLRLSHAQLIAGLQGDPSAVVSMTEEGLGLRVGPIVEEVRDALVRQGFALADRIPEVDRTIILIQPEWLGEAVVVYRATVLVGSWMPVVVVLLMAGGVLAAVHHRRAAVWAAAGLGLGALAVLIALSMGRTVSALAVPPSLMPPDVLELSYDTLVQGLSDVMAAVLTLATVLALALWLSGSSSVARRVRATGTGLQGGVHAWADHHGLSTGRFGVWLHRQRTWLRVVVAALAVGALVMVRPISVGDVLVITAVWLGVLVLLALCERPQPEHGTRT